MIGRTILQSGICALLLAGPVAAEFQFSFDWAGLKLCTSGSPNTVSNPQFKVTDLPNGTTFINFTLTDLDVPGYRHGGGWVEMSDNGTVPANAFEYQSPCPPSRSEERRVGKECRSRWSPYH